MRTLIRQTHAVINLELMRTARAPATTVALCGFISVLILGQILHLKALPPRPDDDRFFGYAFLIAAMIGLRLGLSTDRKRGSDQLLLGNLIRPAALYLGKIITLACNLLIFAGAAALCATISTAGDWNFALWYTVVMTLTIWCYMPLLLLTELSMDTHYPGPAAFALFVLLVVIGAAIIGADQIVQLLGFQTQRFTYSSLIPLARRTLLATCTLALGYPLWRWRTGPL